MVLKGIVGKWREQARLKLLLSDAVRQQAFCVRFNYRMEGLQTGTLRVMTDSRNVLWENRHIQDHGWNMENVDVTWSDSAPESVRNSMMTMTHQTEIR